MMIRALLLTAACLALTLSLPAGAQSKDSEREPEPKVEVTLGPGTVVFIAAVIQEDEEEEEMLAVRYDARFDKVKVPCVGDEKHCTEIRLDAIGFPSTFEAAEKPCTAPLEIRRVLFNGRELTPTKPPRNAEKRRTSAWFKAGFRVDDGATILASYGCPLPPSPPPA